MSTLSNLLEPFILTVLAYSDWFGRKICESRTLALGSTGVTIESRICWRGMVLRNASRTFASLKTCEPKFRSRWSYDAWAPVRTLALVCLSAVIVSAEACGLMMSTSPFWRAVTCAFASGMMRNTTLSTFGLRPPA